MKKKKQLLLVAGVVLLLLLVFLSVVLPNLRGQDKGNQDVAKKSEPTPLKDRSRLPGFDSRRESNEKEYTEEDFQPRGPGIPENPVVIREGEKASDLSEEELQQIIREQISITAFLSEKSRKEFESWLLRMANELNLTNEQVLELESRYRALEDRALAGELEAQGDQELWRLGKESELDVFGDVLTPEQEATRQTLEVERREVGFREAASQEGRQVQQLLGLSEQRRVAVEEALTNWERQQYEGQLNPPSQNEILQRAESLASALRDAEAGENPIAEFMASAQTQERQTRLEALSGLLTASEIARYEESLTAREEVQRTRLKGNYGGLIRE